MFMALSSVQINEMSTPLCRGASKIPFLAALLRVSREVREGPKRFATPDGCEAACKAPP